MKKKKLTSLSRHGTPRVEITQKFQLGFILYLTYYSMEYVTFQLALLGYLSKFPDKVTRGCENEDKNVPFRPFQLYFRFQRTVETMSRYRQKRYFI